MESNELRQLSEMLRTSGFTCLEFSRAGESVRLAVSPGSGAVTIAHMETPGDAVASAANAVTAQAGSAGVFLAAHPLRDAPFVRVGQTVAEGDVLGLLKIGPIYAPIPAPAAGVVSKIVAAEGALLGFGSPVMELGPA